ncbi:hypothetical protein TcasGA2_TC012692 [Tribolium castaneum]|uniref:Uncharacterized protein n=1 Tax=Tribolium castaneum TaxID=7070 RepID=D6WZL7_TRICA|nr:hypothetical protein TcasGA2_TC012692 [Tribolium castaneum]
MREKQQKVPDRRLNYLVILLLSRKLGEPWRRGIDGDLDLYALLELEELSESELERLLLDTDLDPDLERLLLDDDDLHTHHPQLTPKKLNTRRNEIQNNLRPQKIQSSCRGN